MEKRLFVEAVYSLFIAKITIHLFPFKRVVERLSGDFGITPDPDPESLNQIKRAVYRANLLSFWKNVCLVQSVAARKMLIRRKIASKFYLGLRFENENKLSAHAWLESGNIFITPRGTKKFKEIMSF